MRRLGLLLLSLLVLPPLAVPARGAERGTIEGRVINETTGDAQPGVTVSLTGGGEGIDEISESAVTDRRGRYSFTGLATGEDIFYVVDASYEGGLFAGRPISLPDDTQRPPVIDTTLRVWEPTTNPSAILIRRNDLFVVQREGAVAVIESVRVVNPTNSAYIGRGAALSETDDDEASATPSLGFALPDAALPETLDWIDADIDVPEVVTIPGLGFGITSAIPPGQMNFTFTYQVEGSGGISDLSRTAPYAISELSVFAEKPLEATGNRLEENGEVDIDGTAYTRSSSPRAIDPADPIQILIVAEGGASTALIGGLMAGLALLLVAALWLFSRTKTKRKRAMPPVADPADAREDLLTAIAELDLAHDNGEIDDASWARERAGLKARLQETPVERIP